MKRFDFDDWLMGAFWLVVPAGSVFVIIVQFWRHA